MEKKYWLVAAAGFFLAAIYAAFLCGIWTAVAIKPAHAAPVVVPTQSVVPSAENCNRGEIDIWYIDNRPEFFDMNRHLTVVSESGNAVGTALSGQVLKRTLPAGKYFVFVLGENGGDPYMRFHLGCGETVKLDFEWREGIYK